MIRMINGHRTIGHGGGFAGFSTKVELDTKADLGVIVLTNSIRGGAKAIAKNVFELLYELPKTIRGTAAGGLNRYAGTYRSRWGDLVVVSLDSCLLAFDPQDASPLKKSAILTPKGPATFLISTKDGFESPGEDAKFSGRKLLLGSQPYTKLHRAI